MKSKILTEVFEGIETPLPLLNTEKRAFVLMIPRIEEENNITILLAFVRGSHLYGTANEKSDVDITFVYKQPTDEILKGNYKEQMNVGGNDIVGYEIQRFLQLLGQNNPNILEALDIQPDCLIMKHKSMDFLNDQTPWVSKLTKNTILGYAQSQVKKATGLEKNMNNPQPKERKSILDFCYIINNGQSILLPKFMEEYAEEYKNISPEYLDINNWGLAKIDNGKQLYTLYPNNFGEMFRGLVKEGSTNLRLSEIPKALDGRENYTMWYNLDGFEVHCKQHKSYWEWMEERNEERHQTNEAHGKNYDSKNMMHLFRLLDMAFNVAFTGKIKVRSEDVEWLMEIRRGEVNYEELTVNADWLKNQIEILFEMSELQDKPDQEVIKELLLKFRKDG